MSRLPFKGNQEVISSATVDDEDKAIKRLEELDLLLAAEDDEGRGF